MRTIRNMLTIAIIGGWAMIAWFLLGSPTQDVRQIVELFNGEPKPENNVNEEPKPEGKLPKKNAEPLRPLVTREAVAKIQPGMTLADVEAILGKSGWDESAYAMGPAHRWTVKWASIRNEQKREHEPKDDRACSRELWVSADLMVNVVLDQQVRVLTSDIIALQEE